MRRELGLRGGGRQGFAQGRLTADAERLRAFCLAHDIAME